MKDFYLWMFLYNISFDQDVRPLKAGRCQYYGSDYSYVYESFYTTVSKDLLHLQKEHAVLRVTQLSIWRRVAVLVLTGFYLRMNKCHILLL